MEWLPIRLPTEDGHDTVVLSPERKWYSEHLLETTLQYFLLRNLPLPALENSL
jgi:hypothetical protein